MKPLFIALVIACVLYACGSKSTLIEVKVFDIQGDTLTLELAEDKLTIFCFLAPECPLSQNYVKPINELQNQFEGKITLYNVFSGTVYAREEIEGFITEYDLTPTNIVDTAYFFAQHFGATITPEVYVIDHNENVIYSGKIDNWIASLGVKRQVVTEFYLRDAITQYLAHENIAISKTEAVGCVLE